MPPKVKNPPPTGVKANQYWQQELGHWETKGRGSGNYFQHNNQRWRLDRKAEAGKPVRYSWKSLEAKKGEGRTQSTARNQRLTNTTLDPKASLAFGKDATEPGPVHHAAAATLVGKMHEQFERNYNPNWTPQDGPSDAGKAFLRAMQNRLGLYGGDSPLNLRYYPADNPNVPAVSGVHNRAHTLQRELGINPEQDLTGYSNTQLWQLAQKTAEGVRTIDAELGYMPKYRTVGEAGASLRGVELQGNGSLAIVTRDPELEAILKGTPSQPLNLPNNTPPLTAPTGLEGQTGGFVADERQPEQTTWDRPDPSLAPQVMSSEKNTLKPLEPLATTAKAAVGAYQVFNQLKFGLSVGKEIGGVVLSLAGVNRLN